jgi:hypothetical protein
MPAGKADTWNDFLSVSLSFLLLERPIINETTYFPIGSCVSNGLFFLLFLRIYACIDNELLEGGKKECIW